MSERTSKSSERTAGMWEKQKALRARDDMKDNNVDETIKATKTTLREYRAEN